MIINNKPDNTAVLSNVGEIGEFKIRNSAKAFSILSSGLYANKVRAIIRELSCNAVDSHADAGKHTTPFDVHLPNSLEPYFSIRDYGTGLTHDQVTQIYTTYFESTKTMSNEFIGALGLGSKSPFSYTENFTVTAIKDGRKGVYSAFINGEGVPSIALMMEEQTEEPSGVEIQFSVNDKYDYSKFAQEAKEVYTYFKLRPVISGCDNFKFRDIEYTDKDIIPGVNAVSRNYGYESVAIMGNIAYPIHVPEADETLGSLRRLLRCKLEMQFDIGELDFQASREGLSYIPQTIDSIRAKLEEVNAVLSKKLTAEAKKIKNVWERSLFLKEKADTDLWLPAVIEYINNNKTPLLATDNGRVSIIEPTLTASTLAEKYNISIRGFRVERYCSKIQTISPRGRNVKVPTTGEYKIELYFEFPVTQNANFIVNDTNKGVLARAKYHYRSEPKDTYVKSIYVLDKADKEKPMELAKFLKAINNPPKALVSKASELKVKPRDSGAGAGATILHLENRSYSDGTQVWRNAGKIKEFDKNQTHYYIPLSGYAVISNHGYRYGISSMISTLKYSGIDSLAVKIYGVRKGDIDAVEEQSNWVNVEEFIVKTLRKVTEKDILGIVASSLKYQSEIDLDMVNRYNTIIEGKLESSCPYVKIASKLNGVKHTGGQQDKIETLLTYYAPEKKDLPGKVFDKYVKYLTEIKKMYPLLQYISTRAEDAEVVNYIKLVDNSINEKGSK